jgi:hypothetical protein
MNNYLRNFRNPFNNVITKCIRGPKKKGDKKADAVLSEHLLNFKKNSEDVKILPDEFYPLWVLDLPRINRTPQEMFIGMYTGTSVII